MILALLHKKRVNCSSIVLPDLIQIIHKPFLQSTDDPFRAKGHRAFVNMVQIEKTE